MSAANQLPFLRTAAVFLDWNMSDGSDRRELSTVSRALWRRPPFGMGLSTARQVD
jgi:hypothetical protein